VRRLLCVLAAAIVLAPAAALGDEEVVKQKMKFTEKNGEIRVKASISQLFDSESYEALGSGFESTILIRMWVYPKGGGDPVGFQALSRKVVYDHWDEEYEVELDGPSGRTRRIVKYRAEALKLLTTIKGVPVVRADDLPYEEEYVLVIVAELNPVSEETMAEVRRWLTKGAGGFDREGGVFGSVVNVFVNPKIADADRVLRIRSKPFYRPRPED